MCAGPTAPRPYRVIRLGGEFTQYVRAPLAHARWTAGDDVLIDVSNGIPFFSPLWRRGPVVCLVHHVHTDQWAMRFGRAGAAVGRALEARAVPAVYRGAHFVAVSASTADALIDLGVATDLIRVVNNGVDPVIGVPARRSREPLFLALGRLVAHKRLDLLLQIWERVRAQTGGRLVIAGDGPEGARLAALAGDRVEFLGRVSDEVKLRLLQQAWLLVHPAQHEGWGMVIMEAAATGTPALAFDVAGVRDAILANRTGVLARNEEEFESAWVRLAGDAATRGRLGHAARVRAADFGWDRSVGGFCEVVREAAARG